MGISTRAPRTRTHLRYKMVTVTAANACLVTQIISMMLSTGMLFFPETMMDAYKGDIFSGDGKTLFIYMFGMMGVLLSHVAAVNATMRLPTAKKAARGVCCLGNAIAWGVFMFIDGQMTFNLRVPGIINDLPDAMPKDGMITNLVIAVNYLGWKEAGSPMPKTANLVPSGVLATPLKLILVDGLFWGLFAFGAPAMMMEQYIPGVIGKTGKAQEMIWVQLERIGVNSLLSVMTTAMTLSAVPGDSDTNYRMTRSFLYRNFMLLGFMSRDNVIKNCTGWTMPLATTSVLQMFGIAFFAASQLGALGVTIKKPKSA